ncbi:MAG: hypothetical protein L6Q99_18475 [Planctomycetes bacterium]|nr:hypothetical protein [Planctomycetota bacterium]
MEEQTSGRRERKWQKPKRNWLQIVGIAIVVTVVLYGAAYFTVGFLLERFMPQGPYAGKEPTPFARDVWLVTGADSQGTRYLMLDDLLAKHPLVGMQRADVEALLGEAHDAGSLGKAYYLGPKNSPIGSSRAFLVLTYDAADVVTSATVQTD